MGDTGAQMAAEIAEQPVMLERILTDGQGPARDAARLLAARSPRMVLLAARGTSDHAALYAKYCIELMLGLPVGLVSPSVFSVYDSSPALDGALVVAISQSGGSPDLHRTIEVARSAGAMTLAVTNTPQSPLNTISELSLDVMAGPELAVAATKSYTAELLTLYLLIDAWAGGDAAEAVSLPETAARVTGLRSQAQHWAERYRYSQRIVTTARGYAYPTAREAALKLMECTYVGAHAFSGADLLHGPLAMLAADTPVIAVMPEGRGTDAMQPVIQRLTDRGVEVAVVGPSRNSDTPGLTTPRGTPEPLAPIVDIIGLQWLVHAMAVARGIDPDSPRGLTKETHTS